ANVVLSAAARSWRGPQAWSFGGVGHTLAAAAGGWAVLLPPYRGDGRGRPVAGRLACPGRRGGRPRAAPAAGPGAGRRWRSGLAQGGGERGAARGWDGSVHRGAGYGNPGIVAALSNSIALVASVPGAALYRERADLARAGLRRGLLLGVALATVD